MAETRKRLNSVANGWPNRQSGRSEGRNNMRNKVLYTILLLILLELQSHTGSAKDENEIIVLKRLESEDNKSTKL